MSVWFIARKHRPRRNILVFFTLKDRNSLYIGRLKIFKRYLDIWGSKRVYYISASGKMYKEKEVEFWTYVNLPTGAWEDIRL